jgi:hypothetical protein
MGETGEMRDTIGADRRIGEPGLEADKLSGISTNGGFLVEAEANEIQFFRIVSPKNQSSGSYRLPLGRPKS